MAGATQSLRLSFAIFVILQSNRATQSKHDGEKYLITGNLI